ncbi:probable pectinesterase 66 [Abrus precatorius]|uniref:Pectinesterase n=1 Tax=Abrus precatorius TaxID=3816 RepID=A0A8B8KBI6_ABRPR|nr:probable pectinesterase 66 [Abrus precatorius]
MNCSNPPKVIYVNESGQRGTFKTIQSAIESLPKPNSQWTHIRISAGTYTETVFISKQRACLYLEGGGSSSTIVTSSGHDRMSTSFTFASLADDIVVKGISFVNSYNRPPYAQLSKGNLPALAAKIEGDRTAFYNCSFKGVQDTLWDCKGRHYFKHCYIQGAIDFIFGDAQSIYEKSVIYFTLGGDGPKGHDGTITAQKRGSMDSPTGFVIKECNISGNGRAQLGRAYGPFSRVIIANSTLSDVVRPEGWSAWGQVGHEANLTFVEEGNSGVGANQSKRVSWMKHLDANELNKFLNISYIDQEGWITKQPIYYY